MSGRGKCPRECVHGECPDPSLAGFNGAASRQLEGMMERSEEGTNGREGTESQSKGGEERGDGLYPSCKNSCGRPCKVSSLT